VAWLKDLLEERDVELKAVYRDAKRYHGFVSAVVSNAIQMLPIEKFNNRFGEVVLSMREEESSN